MTSADTSYRTGRIVAALRENAQGIRHLYEKFAVGELYDREVAAQLADMAVRLDAIGTMLVDRDAGAKESDIDIARAAAVLTEYGYAGGVLEEDLLAMSRDLAKKS